MILWYAYVRCKFARSTGGSRRSVVHAAATATIHEEEERSGEEEMGLCMCPA